MKYFSLNKNIFLIYLYWHFISIPREIILTWKNFFIFVFNFFSVSFLVKTFFSYWHKYQWEYGKNFDLKRYFNTFFSNLVSRLFGVIFRLIFIIFAFLIEIIIFFIGVVFLIFWLLLPLISILFIIYGLNLIYYGIFL